MATQEELFRIILDVTGKEKVDQARAAIAQEEAEIRKLIAALKAGTISQGEFNAQSLKSAAAIQQAGQAIQSFGGKVNTQGLNQLAYAIDDLQYGFKGIANNIQPVLMGFSATAAYAGPIAILATVINGVVTNWDTLAKLWGGGHTKTQAEEMEELRKKTSLTADEAERLARAMSTPEKVKELRAAPTDAEGKRDEAVTKALSEAGIRNVAQGILRADPGLVDRTGDVPAALQGLEKARKDNAQYLNGEFMPGTQGYEEGQSALNAATEKLAQARDKAAEDLAATAAQARLHPGALARLQGLVDKDPNAFGPGGNQLGKALEAISPTQISEAEKERRKLNPRFAPAEAGPDDAAYAEDERLEQERIQADQDRENKRQYEAWATDAEEEKAAQKLFDEAEAEGRNRLAEWESKGAEEEERLDREAQALLERTEKEGRERLASWQVEGDQRISEEDQAAQVSDILRKRNEDRDRTSQVLNGPASLRDSIQSSIKADNLERTAVQQLEETREVVRWVKQMAEQREAQRAAMAG